MESPKRGCDLGPCVLKRCVQKTHCDHFLRFKDFPRGPARHLDALRQKLTPHCLAAIFDSQLPSPKLSLKMPPKLPLPHNRGHFFLFQNCPRGEGNCAAIERQKLSRGNFCLAASRCLSWPSGKGTHEKSKVSSLCGTPKILRKERKTHKKKTRKIGKRKKQGNRKKQEFTAKSTAKFRGTYGAGGKYSQISSAECEVHRNNLRGEATLVIKIITCNYFCFREFIFS